MHEAQHANPSSTIPLQKLTERLRLLQQDNNAMPEPVVVEDVITAVLDTFDGRLSPREAVLLREIAGLGRIIEDAKAGVAELSVDEIRGSHIPIATGELGAVVEHTAMATNIILENCETLDRLAGTLDAASSGILQNATMQMYEACSFQDITGQRISKAIKALQAIEARVLALSTAYIPCDSASDAEPFVPRRDVADAEDDLLNGPLHAHEAMCQDDIDKLLADFE